MSFSRNSDINGTRRPISDPLGGGWSERFALGLATGFGVGKVPGAPGTAGSLAALPLFLLLQAQPPALYLVTLVGWIALGVWACDRAEKLLGQRDPRCVVLDEVVGMLVALSWVRPGLLSMALGFGFFRLFDILKIPPIRYLERRIPGGLGVMMDDVVAGLYAQIGLRLVLGILR